MLFGSDYPHVEGLADPLSYLEDITQLADDEDIRKIMGGNMMRLLGIEDRVSV